MSALPLALLTQFAMSCPAASAVPLDRVAATATAESGLQATALHDNTTGRSYLPASAAGAVALAAALHAQGHSLDAGVMQVNDANWRRLGLTAETAFEPRANVCAGMAVLADAYAVERRVSCRYNTGLPDCRNGYPERVERAAAQLQQLPTAAPAVVPPVPAAPPGPPPPPSWDVWGQADYLDAQAAAQPAPPEVQPQPARPEAQPAAAPAPDTAAGEGASSVAMATGTPVRQ